MQLLRKQQSINVLDDYAKAGNQELLACRWNNPVVFRITFGVDFTD
jgi:hypothetical protein